MICIQCGKESKLYQNLCSECFASKNSFSSVPNYCDITICPTCNALLKSRQWISIDDFEDAVKTGTAECVEIDPTVKTSNVDIDLDFVSRNIAKAKLTIKMPYDDLTLIEDHDSEVRIKFEQCGNCSKIAANYYTAIIQLRAEGRDVSERETDNCLELVDRQVGSAQKSDQSIFISKLEKRHGGYDIYLSNQSIAKSIAKSLISTFGGTITSSNSLVGQKDGQEIYKMTYLVRLPVYQVGDIAEIDSRIVIIKGFSHLKIELVDLINWNTFKLNPNRIKRIKILEKLDDHVKGQIISRTENEFQVLDLDSYKTHYARIPDNYNEFTSGEKTITEEDEIYIFFHDENCYIIPPFI
jgi:nonsense-mediated mRNA decay protein 3